MSDSDEAPMASTGSWTKQDKILIAHMAVASVALLLLTPSAILISRWMRGKPWLPIHAGLQVLSAILVIVAIALGAAAGGGPESGDHQAMGIAVLVIALAQVALGIFAHFTRSNKRQAPGAVPEKRLETVRDKSPFRYLHILLGLAFVGLGYAQVHSGLELWPGANSLGKDVPRGVTIVYWVVLGLFVGLYLLGWLPELRKPKRTREYDEKPMTATSTNSA